MGAAQLILQVVEDGTRAIHLLDGKSAWSSNVLGRPILDDDRQSLYQIPGELLGGAAHRLARALEYARAGDALVVWQLDRLGRSLTQLIELMTHLDERGIGFRSLTEQIDTTTSGGKLIFHIFGALAEFEQNLIRERTKAGLSAARARGRFGGRPKLPDTDRKIQMARKLQADPTNSIADICNALGVSRATLYRYLSLSKANTDSTSE